MVFVLSWLVETIFDNSSTVLITAQLLSCQNYKRRNFVNSVDNVMELSTFVNN